MALTKYIIVNSIHGGENVANHSHSCYELIYYLFGDVEIDYAQIPGFHAQSLVDFEHRFQNGEHSLRLKNSQFVLVPPNVVHNEINRIDNEVVAIGFEMESGLEKIDDLTLSVLDDKNLEIRSLIQTIRSEFHAKNYQYESFIDSAFRQILIKILRSKFSSHDENGLHYIASYLDQNFTIPLSMDKIAALAGYSVSRFRFLFNQTYGMSPKRYIEEKRIAYADKLVRESKMTLKEIAGACGFTDYYQFSAFFKRETGKTISSIRRSL